MFNANKDDNKAVPVWERLVWTATSLAAMLNLSRCTITRMNEDEELLIGNLIPRGRAWACMVGPGVRGLGAGSRKPLYSRWALHWSPKGPGGIAKQASFGKCRLSAV